MQAYMSRFCEYIMKDHAAEESDVLRAEELK